MGHQWSMSPTGQGCGGAASERQRQCCRVSGDAAGLVCGSARRRVEVHQFATPFAGVKWRRVPAVTDETTRCGRC